jgi:LPXTG-site transpeptidase (sortase) family protein
MEIKKLWKVFIILFLVIFLIFNWNEVSWIFNYRAVSGLLSDFFKGSDKEIVSDKEIQKIDQYDYYEGEEDKSSSSPFVATWVKEDSLEIPKIGVSAPLVFTETAEQEEIKKSLDVGVVHFPDSVLPGQAGQTIILGHSAPPNWPDIKYDDVFSRLNELEKGDEIFIYFEHQKFNYSVTNKFFLERGEEVPEYLTNSDNMLVLISCWPPGKDIRRIAVEATIKR